jgi:endo-beta-N-acetylglucosaminidase D
MLQILAETTAYEFHATTAALTAFLTGIAAIIGTTVYHRKQQKNIPNESCDQEETTRARRSRYVTWDEFRDYKKEIRADVSEIKTMIGETLKKIEGKMERDEEARGDCKKDCNEKIEGVARTAYQARKEIHKQVNEIDRGLAVVEDRLQIQRKVIA